MDYVQILIELIIGYFSLFFIMKISGKTQMTQITPFDFISVLILGELVGNAVYDHEIKLPKILFAVFIWGLLIYFIEFLTQKSIGLRKFFEGEPTIVIRKGKIDFNVLKRYHIDINQLQHLLRDKNIFSIRECEYAIIETNGTINVLKKGDLQTVTIKDMKLPAEKVTLPVTLILDGDLLKDNLEMIGWSEKKLMSELKKHNVHSIKEVLYGEYMEGKPLFIQKYEKVSK